MYEQIAKADRLQTENAALRADNAGLLQTLQYIQEYWNRDENLKSMSDALWHILDIIGDELNGMHPGDSPLKELEALRNLQTISIDVLEWLKKNGYGGTGHARCLEDALAAVKGE